MAILITVFGMLQKVKWLPVAKNNYLEMDMLESPFLGDTAESLDFLVYSTVPVRQIETACVLSLNYLFINTILAMQRAHWMHRSSC